MFPSQSLVFRLPAFGSPAFRSSAFRSSVILSALLVQDLMNWDSKNPVTMFQAHSSEPRALELLMVGLSTPVAELPVPVGSHPMAAMEHSLNA